jgi:hypothetical protein
VLGAATDPGPRLRFSPVVDESIGARVGDDDDEVEAVMRGEERVADDLACFTCVTTGADAGDDHGGEGSESASRARISPEGER